MLAKDKLFPMFRMDQLHDINQKNPPVTKKNKSRFNNIKHTHTLTDINRR